LSEPFEPDLAISHWRAFLSGAPADYPWREHGQQRLDELER
jgi:hypothetical protein